MQNPKRMKLENDDCRKPNTTLNSMRTQNYFPFDTSFFFFFTQSIRFSTKNQAQGKRSSVSGSVRVISFPIGSTFSSCLVSEKIKGVVESSPGKFKDKAARQWGKRSRRRSDCYRRHTRVRLGELGNFWEGGFYGKRWKFWTLEI